MQGWVDLVGLVTYRGGIPAQIRSPIPVLTGLNVEQLRSCDERRYHSLQPIHQLLTANDFWYRYGAGTQLEAGELWRDLRRSFGDCWRRARLSTGVAHHAEDSTPQVTKYPVNFHFISFIVHETDRVYNHDVEDKNIISVVGSLAIAGQISLLSNVIKLHKNKM